MMVYARRRQAQLGRDQGAGSQKSRSPFKSFSCECVPRLILLDGRER